MRFEPTIPESEQAKTIHALDLAAIVTVKVRKVVKGEGKGIPVTGRGGPLGCETLRLPYFLDNRLTDGGKVVSLTRRPPFTPRKIPGTHFC
jgi:hypothetical protein